MRIAACIGIMACGLAWAGSDLSACGDKYNRIGRVTPFGKYVALHRAAILIYAPKNSAPSRTDLTSVLKKAGHYPLVVADAPALSAAMASGKYDLVLAGLPDAKLLAAGIGQSSGSPAIVPVLIKPTKAEIDAALALSSCLLDLSAHKNEALEEIDHRMELRLNPRAAGVTR
jgi:hypothetical protein